MRRKKWSASLYLLMLFSFLFVSFPNQVNSEEKKESPSSDDRIQLYKNMEVLYQIPWYYVAAIDQYERNIQPVKKDQPARKGLISIQISKERWAGSLNPFPENQNPETIQFFNGLGLDGNGDGKANRDDDTDILVSFLTFLSRYGVHEEHILKGLSDYYNDQAAKIIGEMAAIFKHFDNLELSERIFPIPKWHNYSYRSTWGDSRGWGGLRIHEGTDIFASYGTPVRSVCYGYVEVLGWNKYGGWRVGIRGINNIYYYYAHLSGFKKGLAEGDTLKPGDVIGYVGSSGYGPPGTQGKFPPHLHFGMYKYNGKNEWAFDPTPYLRIWERKMKQSPTTH